MTVKQIVHEWVKEHGYDGLYSDIGCGCKLDDFIPCDMCSMNCMPGHIIPCPGPEKCWAGGDCTFHIGLKDA